MNSPFISVCIPAYKNVEYVERLLGSIREQSFRDFEIVIADNSPDNCIELLAEQFNHHFLVRYFRNDPPTEMAENHNRVLQKAVGSWIKIMHDDDWFAGPAALETFANRAKRGKSKFIFSGCRNIHTPSGKVVNETLTGWRKAMLEENPLNLFYLNVIGHPSTVMHYNDGSLLYDTHLKWVLDIDFYMRFLNKYPGFDYIPELLVNIGISENQFSNQYYKNPAVEIPEYLSMLEKYPADLLLKHEYVFHLVWNLVKRYKIKSSTDFGIYGYHGQLPDAIDGIIRCQKNIPGIILKQTPWSKKLMKQCFNKLRLRIH